LISIASFLLLLALVACQAAPTATPTPSSRIVGAKVEVEGGYYYDVTARQLKTILESKDFLLVNVKTPYSGEIEGTDLYIPYNVISSRVDELPADKSEKIVIYCRSGNTSLEAVRTLVALGYTNLWNLRGGLQEWAEAGYEVVWRDRQ
jgi:rhodanese-related sulfurtransferase